MEILVLNIAHLHSFLISSDCGSPNTAFESNLSRIIWGDAARSHEFPWLASLHKIKYPHVPGKKFNSRSAFCGGTLINDLYVLTGDFLYSLL